jgi:hypothetical protein
MSRPACEWCCLAAPFCPRAGARLGVDVGEGGAYPRLLESIGKAAPQYEECEEDVA